MLLNLFLTLSLVSQAQNLPRQPDLAEHPSSAQYQYDFKIETWTENGRRMDLYLPVSKTGEKKPYPLIVFGHGQATDVTGYDLSFRHLAKKGIAVLHPMYDSGFFDQKWRRMADDFNQLTMATLKKFPELNPRELIYSGHSKGGYVALMAAGAPSHSQLERSAQKVLLFAPAGFDVEYLKNMNPEASVTLVYSDADTIIKRPTLDELYSKLNSRFKQLIEVVSYPELKADHFYPLSKSFFFGGTDGVSAHHYYASWKFLVSAALDVQSGSPLKNPYLYGDEALKTGVDGLSHKLLQKSF